MGRAIAARCAADGAALALIDVLEDEGSRATAELAARGAEAVFQRCDITRYEELLALVEMIRARWGRLDTSKGAIIGLTRGLARELGPHEVTVNAIAPGLTPTEATTGVSERRRQQYRSARMLKREPVPEEVASVAAFLLSDDAGYMTGQTLAVNGGMTAS